MRTTGKKQILSTDALNSHGAIIPAEAINWSGFDKNPVLLYNRTTEAHNGVAVGLVANTEVVGGKAVGELVFMENNEDADIAFEKYSQGILNYVSVGGTAIGKYDENKIFNVEEYRLNEISLVRHPANMECAPIEDEEIPLAASADAPITRYLTMCAELRTLDDNTNINQTSMEQEIKNVEVPANEPVVETPETEETLVVETPETPATEQEPEVETPETEETPVVETPETPAETVTQTVEASATVIAGTQNVVKEPALPEGMQWHEKQSLKTKPLNMDKTFKELLCSEDFTGRMRALGNEFRTSDPSNPVAQQTQENKNLIVAMACSMLNTPEMVNILSVTKIDNQTNTATSKYTNALEMVMDCAAGNAAAATLAAADLGVINWLSMVYQQLFANDTFTRSIRFVPMSDRAGAIFVESQVRSPRSFGNVAPIARPEYIYEDIKRTIERKVMTFDPITFQHPELAILNYDKRGYGVSESTKRMLQDAATYWLQVYANTPGIYVQGTTGDVVNTTNMFPIEAPLSNLNVHKPTVADLIALEGAFLMNNYSLSGRPIEVVASAQIYSMIAGDPEFRSSRTLELDANLGAHINFSSMRITPRNPVARYNTATPGFELDPALYTDFITQPNGSSVAVTPATTTAQHEGAAIAFVENEVIAGIGAIELIVVNNPYSYGSTISGWMSTGATVARSNGVGVGAIVPTVEVP